VSGADGAGPFDALRGQLLDAAAAFAGGPQALDEILTGIVDDVARALAEKEGWDYVELSNNNDPATALKNAQIFVQEGVNAVIQFNGQPSSNPAISAVL